MNNEVLNFDPTKLNVFSNKKYIYLAGKISPTNDWRGKIMTDNFRVCSFGGYDVIDYGGKKFLADEAIIDIPETDNLKTCGPFFLSCDHSCFHGVSSHGLGANQEPCIQENEIRFSEQDVKDICLSQINRSDLVLAYIDSPDCYGTLYEISYAESKDIPVIIVFETPKLKQDMWFYTVSKQVTTLTLDECKYSSVIEKKIRHHSDLVEIISRLATK